LKINHKIFCPVAPLTQKNIEVLVDKLMTGPEKIAGIPTKTFCEEIANQYKHDSNHCWNRSTQCRPCNTLCYVVIKALHYHCRIQKRNLRELFGRDLEGLK